MSDKNEARFYNLPPENQFEAWQFFRQAALENNHPTIWIDVMCLSEAYFRVSGDRIFNDG